MKKVQSLGRSLSKTEQKNIMGGYVDIKCSAGPSCGKYTNGQWQAGTCSSQSMPGTPSLPPLCICSNSSDGSGCTTT